MNCDYESDDSLTSNSFISTKNNKYSSVDAKMDIHPTDPTTNPSPAVPHYLTNTESWKRKSMPQHEASFPGKHDLIIRKPRGMLGTAPRKRQDLRQQREHFFTNDTSRLSSPKNIPKYPLIFYSSNYHPRSYNCSFQENNTQLSESDSDESINYSVPQREGRNDATGRYNAALKTVQRIRKYGENGKTPKGGTCTNEFEKEKSGIPNVEILKIPKKVKEIENPQNTISKKDEEGRNSHAFVDNSRCKTPSGECTEQEPLPVPVARLSFPPAPKQLDHQSLSTASIISDVDEYAEGKEEEGKSDKSESSFTRFCSGLQHKHFGIKMKQRRCRALISNSVYGQQNQLSKSLFHDVQSKLSDCKSIGTASRRNIPPRHCEHRDSEDNNTLVDNYSLKKIENCGNYEDRQICQNSGSADNSDNDGYHENCKMINNSENNEYSGIREMSLAREPPDENSRNSLNTEYRNFPNTEAQISTSHRIRTWFSKRSRTLRYQGEENSIGWDAISNVDRPKSPMPSMDHNLKVVPCHEDSVLEDETELGKNYDKSHATDEVFDGQVVIVSRCGKSRRNPGEHRQENCMNFFGFPKHCDGVENFADGSFRPLVEVGAICDEMMATCENALMPNLKLPTKMTSRNVMNIITPDNNNNSLQIKDLCGEECNLKSSVSLPCLSKYGGNHLQNHSQNLPWDVIRKTTCKELLTDVNEQKRWWSANVDVYTCECFMNPQCPCPPVCTQCPCPPVCTQSNNNSNNCSGNWRTFSFNCTPSNHLTGCDENCFRGAPTAFPRQICSPIVTPPDCRNCSSSSASHNSGNRHIKCISPVHFTCHEPDIPCVCPTEIPSPPPVPPPPIPSKPPPPLPPKKRIPQPPPFHQPNYPPPFYNRPPLPPGPGPGPGGPYMMPPQYPPPPPQMAGGPGFGGPTCCCCCIPCCAPPQLGPSLGGGSRSRRSLEKPREFMPPNNPGGMMFCCPPMCCCPPSGPRPPGRRKRRIKPK